MALADSPFFRLVFVHLFSSHQKHEQSGDQGPLMLGITAQPTRTTEHKNPTYPQQVATAHLQRQYFTPNIAQFQLKN